jgi:methyl-accepting chemotaxis protein
MSIMTFTRLAGKTGETYLVGEDGLMRSNSRFIEESSILSKRVDTDTVQRALAGETGVETILDYRGVEVMSAFSSIEVGDARWAVIVEIDVEEIIRWSAQDRPSLAGILLAFYGLSLWSLWYWRGRDVPGGGESLAGLDFGDSDGGGFGA